MLNMSNVVHVFRFQRFDIFLITSLTLNHISVSHTTATFLTGNQVLKFPV